MSESQKVLEMEPVETPPPKPSLAQKILEIQDRVGVVKKQGKFTSEMGGSNYLRIEDAVVAVNKLLTAHKLILTGTLRSSRREVHERTGKDGNLARTGYISSVLMDWVVEDTESGEYKTWTFPGDGFDSTDKSIYKAMTGCRKYAIINIFNLPIGNDVEEHGMSGPEDAKMRQKTVAANKIAAAAAAGNKTAIDAMCQVEPEKKLIISRPEEYNGHYVIASGFIAVPALDTFFSDTGCKRIDSRKTGKTGWKVPAEYEEGLVKLCQKLNLEVEG